MSVEEVTIDIEIKDNLEEEVKLIIQPNKDIPWLFRFIEQLQEILVDNDIHGSIVRITGCFNRGTLITLMVRNDNIGKLVINLAFMRNVTKVEENTPKTSTFSNLHNSKSTTLDSSIERSKTLHLILEDVISPQRVPL